jgi:hypothetical protein
MRGISIFFRICTVTTSENLFHNFKKVATSSDIRKDLEKVTPIAKRMEKAELESSHLDGDSCIS